MWVADDYEAELIAYSMSDGSRIPRYDIGLSGAGNHAPMGIWSDGDTMWVVDFWEEKIYAYGLYTGERRPQQENDTLAPGNNSPANIWSNGETIWVVDDWDQKIYAYDLQTGAAQPDLNFNSLGLRSETYPHGVWSDGVTMWLSTIDYSGQFDGLDEVTVTAYNMPASPILKSLDVRGVDIGSFDRFSDNYEARIPNTVSQTTVTGEAAFSDSTVVISPADADANTDGHQVSLGSGDTVITVTVTNGTATRTYTVTVGQVASATLSSDSTLSGLTISDVDFGVFSSATTDYSSFVSTSTTSATVTATANDPDAIVTVMPSDSDTATSGHQVPFAKGVNRVRVVVESADRSSRTV